MTALEAFNTQPGSEAQAALLACCGSSRWAGALVEARPFASPDDLLFASDRVWFSLDEPDWLAAFACHPRIGEKKAATSDYLASSETEQSVAQASLAAVAEALRTGNHAYEERFGFRYIVFASGRTAPELLAVLETRLGHTRDQELHEAARQQARITTLRMRKWMHL